MAREPVMPDAETTLRLSVLALRAGRVAWGCLLVLMLGLSAGIMLLPPAGKEPNLTILAIALVPLAAFVPGLRRRSVLSHLWLSLLMLLYMTVSMQNLFLAEVRWLDWVIVAAEVLLFLACLMFVRWRAREIRGRAAMEG